MPPCSAGCSVLTRPSSISGNRVTADTLVTANPPAASARDVPPVATSSNPRAARPCANVSRPVLSETLGKALGILTKVQYYFYPTPGGPGAARKRAANRRPFFLVFPFVQLTRVRVTARRKKND